MRPRTRIRLFLLLAGLLPIAELEAQNGRLNLDQRSRWNDTRQFLKRDTLPPMGFKPWREGTVHPDSNFSEFPSSDSSRSLLHRKLFQEHLLRIEEGPLKVSIDPLLDLELGKDFADPTAYGDTTTLYRNQRGFRIQGRIGERIAFHSRLRESQLFLPRYLRDYVNERGVVPGQGRVKPFEGNGFDHSMVAGELSYKVAEEFRIAAGHGKHFIGEGYRSLLLSDNAFNYPYLEFEHEWWDGRIGYRNLYTGFSSLERMPRGDAPEALFKPKAGTFHYLDIRLFPWMRIGLFEGTVRKRWSDEKGVLPIDPSTLSPVIFTNTLVQGFSGEHNVVAGVDLRARISPRILLYGQSVLDDPERERYGYQLGMRLFNLGMENFDLLLEYDRLMPNTFTHSASLQHYGHYGQPLAHPLGTDFEEFIARADLTVEPFFLRLAFNYATPLEGKGSAIFGSGTRTDPSRTELMHQRASAGLIVNPKNRMELATGIQRRLEGGSGNAGQQETLYVHLTLRTSLANSYSDL